MLDHRVKTKVGNVKKQTVKYAHGSCIGDVTPNSFLLLSLKKCLTHESDLSSYMGHKSWEPRKITKKKKKEKKKAYLFVFSEEAVRYLQKSHMAWYMRKAEHLSFWMIRLAKFSCFLLLFTRI